MGKSGTCPNCGEWYESGSFANHMWQYRRAELKNQLRLELGA